jgi:hypothetical protein
MLAPDRAPRPPGERERGGGWWAAASLDLPRGDVRSGCRQGYRSTTLTSGGWIRYEVRSTVGGGNDVQCLNEGCIPGEVTDSPDPEVTGQDVS